LHNQASSKLWVGGSNRTTARQPIDDEATSFVQQGSDPGVLPSKRAQKHI
jgi:hypothetical protein